VKGAHGCPCLHVRKQNRILSFALQFGEKLICGAKEQDVAN
jgi:hypothetical protein